MFILTFIISFIFSRLSRGFSASVTQTRCALDLALCYYLRALRHSSVSITVVLCKEICDVISARPRLTGRSPAGSGDEGSPAGPLGSKSVARKSVREKREEKQSFPRFRTSVFKATGRSKENRNILTSFTRPFVVPSSLTLTSSVKLKMFSRIIWTGGVFFILGVNGDWDAQVKK